jgi:hypothetical protein
LVIGARELSAALAGSTLSADYLAHGFPARGLQGSEPAPREKPYAFVFVAAVNNVDAVAHNCVVKSGAGILSNEGEELLPPWIICVPKDFVTERFQFFDADRTDRVCNGFAPLLIEVLKIKFFEWHNAILVDIAD